MTEYLNGTMNDVLVNSLAASGSSSTPVYNAVGPVYLDINSECSWHIVVTG